MRRSSYHPNQGLPRMLTGYLIDCWACGKYYSRRLVRTSQVFVGNHRSTYFGMGFRAVWHNTTGYLCEDKGVILGLFPTGLMIYNEPLLYNSRLSMRAVNMIQRWVQENTEYLGRHYRLDGVEFQVLKIKVPVFNIATRGTRSFNENNFNNHLVESLATTED